MQVQTQARHHMQPPLTDFYELAMQQDQWQYIHRNSETDTLQ